jgi:hypothetical protein
MHRFDDGLAYLAEQGLNLVAVLDCSALPESITAPLAHAQRLVLIGSGGRRLWQALSAYGLHTADPIDHFSRLHIERFVREYLGAPPYRLLYPGDYPIPLQQLGTLAGWQQPSPLGIGIHPEYGLWFAYRAAFLTTLELPLRSAPPAPSPCATCSAKPCVSACPASAVSAAAAFDLAACIEFCLSAQSPCQSQCLARLACPVAAEQRYSAEQLRYHYGRSLHTLRAYRRN